MQLTLQLKFLKSTLIKQMEFAMDEIKSNIKRAIACIDRQNKSKFLQEIRSDLQRVLAIIDEYQLKKGLEDLAKYEHQK